MAVTALAKPEVMREARWVCYFSTISDILQYTELYQPNTEYVAKT